MAEYTEHYNLELPANAEHYDIKVANTNNKIIDEKLYEKVEKIPNKGLSTNDFTNGYKQKLDSLKNYDDTQIKKDISNIQKEQETQNTNIEENNSKIVELQTEKAKLETELKEIQEDFYQNSIRGQASGEYIHVEDSSNCRAKIGINGNSEQETSPSTDYPSEIKTVGSNVNIFDIIKYDYRYLAGASVQINDKTNFRITATMNNNANCAVGFKILDLTKYAGKTLTVKAYAKSSTSANKAFIVLRQNDSDYTGTKSNELYDESQNTTNGSITLKYKVTDTVNDNNRYLFIWFYATRGVACNIGDYVDYKVKLAEGTEVGEYSKFGQGCVKVTKCNKNIWNLGNKGNNSGDISFPLKSGKYTLSFKKKRISNSTITNAWVYRYAYIRFYDKNDTLLSSIKDGMAINLTANQTSDRQIIDFTAPENTVKMIVNFSNNNGDNNNNTESIEIQLEGEKATSFEQHEEQSYIMPVQQEMLEGDYFDFDNEEEVHIFGKKVLTGNENWEAIGTNTSGKYRFQTKVDDIAFNADGDTYLEGICDSYKVGTPNTTYLCQESIATVQNYLIIYNEKVNDTVENFEKGLSNKNVTIYYKLATPARLPFTDEQKAVAKELNNARTYKNVTNITTDSIAILDLDYAKDLETLLNNTQALAVNNASEGV